MQPSSLLFLLQILLHSLALFITSPSDTALPATTDATLATTLESSCPLLLQAEAGFRCSAGISSNRMLAKLVSGLHKPDDQTVLLPPDAADFVAPLPVRALPGASASVVMRS